MPDRGPGPLDGVRVVEFATLAAGPMVGTALGEFGAEVIKVEQPGAGDPMRTWGDRRGRHRPGVEEREPQQALRDPRPAPARGPGPLPPAARHQRRARRRQPAERPRALGHRLRVGPRGPPAGRDAPPDRLRGGRTEERSPRLRDPGRGHERVRPPDRPNRRAPHPAPVHAGRRGGGARRDLRGDDRPLPPRRPRWGRPAHRREPDRAPGPAHGVGDPGLRPARGRPGPGRQHAPGQRAPQRLPHRGRPVGRHLQRGAEHRRPPVPGHRPPGPGRGSRLRRSRPPTGARRRAGRPGGDLDRRADHGRGDGGLRGGRGRRRPRLRRASSCWPTSTCRPGAPSCPSPTRTSARSPSRPRWCVLSETPGRIDHLGRGLGADNEAVYGGLLGLSADQLADLESTAVI